MKNIFTVITICLITIILQSCHDQPEYNDDPYGNFDALADIVEQRYCFLNEKDLDWDYERERCRRHIKPNTNTVELFNICAALLNELKDGHVNLSSRFNTSYYRRWWTDYPQDFSMRCLQEYYLDFNYSTTSGMIYKMLPDSIGYIYYPSFSSNVSETGLDYILAFLYKAKGLIIDVRDNGGGNLTNVGKIAARFIDKKTIGGYISHKTGPGRDEFSKPYPVEYEPADPEYHLKWDGNVAVLTNRSCFSAANDFVSVMKAIPNVYIVGARTGGGGGLPFSSELPNGWSVRFSACPMYDSEMNPTEDGILPSPGCEVHSPEEELAEGKDRILDFAIDLLLKKAKDGADTQKK